MMKIVSIGLLLCTFFSPLLHAQDEQEETEDFSQYEEFSGIEGKEPKTFAAPKIIGLSPAKLVSVGYDVQGASTLQANATDALSRQRTGFSSTHGLRVSLNLPVVSNTRWLVNVGANYIETNYAFSGQVPQDPLARVLTENGLRSMGINSTVFKPRNEKTFLLGYVSADLNGDYSLSQLQSIHTLRYSWTLMYGKRPHDRLQYAVGVSQSYRAGEVNFFPTILYNYTSLNRKWGVEILLPAKAHVRRKFKGRNMLLLGYELEGQTYRLNDRNQRFPENNNAGAYPKHYNPSNLELRRSEIRARLIYEKGLSDFIWLSAQVGYVINYRYNLDSGEFFRGFFNDQPYVMQNKLTNPFYVNFSVNLVSP